jgi:selenocysteine lyase/cysteine desulfurase
VGFQAALAFHRAIGSEASNGVSAASPPPRRRARALPESGSARRVRLLSERTGFLRGRGDAVEEVIRRLWENGPVRVRHVAENGLDYVRLSTHIYNTPGEVDRVVEMVGEIANPKPWSSGLRPASGLAAPFTGHTHRATRRAPARRVP